uniref:TonB C-terminal domain-containing protein n=1 Tax=Nitratidesulfovibrio vulgaris (strain DSM 19637 / Miyazaki F) TaxID=883 RepID=B8DQ57_NITV9
MVVVRLHIDPQGRVASRNVVGEESVNLFADTAMCAVKRWLLHPCGRGWRDVACEVGAPEVFKLFR